MPLSLKHAFAISAALVLGGCVTLQPDLPRLYGMEQGASDQPPVILIHGALGSRLVHRESGEEVWPGTIDDLLFSDYEEFRLDIDPETLEPRHSALVTSGITDTMAGIDYYASIRQVLEDAAGFVHTETGTPAHAGQRRYYVFEYDWRQDNLASVRALHAFIEQIRRDYSDPTLKVDVIAHSMGGLITRYYARYGVVDVLNNNDFPVTGAGARRLRRVILLGTPNLGTAEGLRSLAEGYRVGLGVVPAEVTATFPSSYQVLPHALNDWIVTADGAPLQSDIFDVDTWRTLEVSVFAPDVRARILDASSGPEEAESRLRTLEAYFERHIERARRFTWSLTVPVGDGIPFVRYVVFGGDCHETLARVVAEFDDGHYLLRWSADDIEAPKPGIDYEALMLEPGDGTVTKASLLARQSADPGVRRHEFSYFPLHYPLFLCERHTQLTGNINFQDNLLHAILSVDDW
jgi:pimeloyl-ACP methyl ester carboxylesterase